MQGISVLLVDNNERFLKTLEEYLGEQDFIQNIYMTASDSAAMRIAAEKKPHLILLDVLMPGRNGIEMIPEFRENAPHAKIIMLTLWDMNGYRDSARAAGADDFVAKRTMTERLLPAMKKAVAV